MYQFRIKIFLLLLILISESFAQSSFVPGIRIDTTNMTNATQTCVRGCIVPRPSDNAAFILKTVLVSVLIIFSGLTAGMQIGLMGLDPMTLQV